MTEHPDNNNFLLPPNALFKTATPSLLVQSVKPGRDRREHLFSLTAAGKRQMAKAKPHWDLAESRLRKELGERGWKEMKESLSVVTKGAIQAQSFPRPR